MPPKSSTLVVSILSLFLFASIHAAETQIQLLSGTGSDDTVEWQFHINGGRNSGAWSTIPVPSNWEMQGFGSYHYYRDWGDDLTDDTLANYRHTFAVPAEWKEQIIQIVFGGSMTDTTVRINGRLAGPTHQGGFYQFSYDITKLLNFGGQNILEVEVKKISDNHSVNLAEREADYWLFGGIFRPVWLEAKPAHHIERLALDARHTGQLSIDLALSPKNTATHARIQIAKHGSEKSSLKRTIALNTADHLELAVPNISPWTAETPNLYDLQITLLEGKNELHTVHHTFGFRTIEVRPKDGIYVNGSRVLLKGVNRHTIWPTTGRTTNRDLSFADVRLMKEMNLNAVRMSHYPPDPHFLDACDQLGLYVIDELGGWQKSYDSEVGDKLVVETVLRDVNHPSIILWANGNEGGWNTDLDDDYAPLDPQKRTVIHPWNNFNGIETSHYESYNAGAGSVFHGDDIIMPTEFLHALYDGGAAAGLDDWWNAILRHPAPGGGFIWAFADEGIARDDQEGRIDVSGNQAPDGVVGPYREKEASFFAIKEIWAPIYLPLSERDRLPPSFDGTLRVENRYDHTNLSNVSFKWTLRNTSDDATLSGSSNIQLAPWNTAILDLQLPKSWNTFQQLDLTATDAQDHEIYTWSWMLQDTATIANTIVKKGQGPLSLENINNTLTASTADSRFTFDSTSGQLLSAIRNNRAYPISNGPNLLTSSPTAASITFEQTPEFVKIHARSEGNLRSFTWTLHPSGWLQLDYHYRLDNRHTYPYIGIGFTYDETAVTGINYLGKGPYRVWNNRRKGAETGVWEKDYNDTTTGANSWIYPEFKGFHEDLYWATLLSDTTPITVVSATNDLFLGLFKPADSPEPRDSKIIYPEADLSFLHAISPIGTKFQPASNHGPQGQPHIIEKNSPGFSGTLYFHLDQK